MYATGIGYRIDRVSQAPGDYDNPYDIMWDPEYSGDLYLLEDDREVLGMAMLRAGETDVNTEDQAQVDAALADIQELADAVNPRIGVEAYTILPEGRATIIHEVLHSLGLGENPPKPPYITYRVKTLCW